MDGTLGRPSLPSWIPEPVHRRHHNKGSRWLGDPHGTQTISSLPVPMAGIANRSQHTLIKPRCGLTILFCSVPDSHHLSRVTGHPKITPLTILTWTRTLRNTAVNTLLDMVPGRSTEHCITAQDIVPALSTCTFPANAMLNMFVYFGFFWRGAGQGKNIAF